MRENSFACVIWSENMAVTGETATRSVNLAQATQSRLGETNKGSPWPDRTKSRPDDSLNFWASEPLAQARSRSSSCFPCFEPRLSGGGLAWARLLRLSETPQPERDAGRDNAVIWMLDVSRVIYFGWVWWYDEWYIYNGACGMFDMIHEFHMMGWVCYWHMKWMRGLVLKEPDINMRRGPRLIGVVMIRGMDLRCDAYEELISRVDMKL